jgi:hypothetical protein
VIRYRSITCSDDLYSVLPYIDGPVNQQIVLQRLKMAGEHAALYVNDELVGAGGITQHWSGVGDAWLVITPWGSLYRKTLYKTVKKTLHNWMEQLGLWRVECVIKAEFIYGPSLRLVSHLGFQFEGTQVMYGPDKTDYHRYALVKGN